MSSTGLQGNTPTPETLKPGEKPPHGSHRVRNALIVMALIAIVLITGIRSRLKATTTLQGVANQAAISSVSVVNPKPTAGEQEVILPGNMEPLILSPIYARTDGYLRRWFFDIGAHVKKGDLLAIIETPEVDQQLEQARGNLATAQANLELSRITKERYEGLLKKHAVSQQDADNAAAALQANQAILDADKANVQRYETLVSFEKVYAPFDGIITARNTDVGDLINAGSSTAPRTELFEMSQAGTLRVYVNVPEEFSQNILPGHTQADVVLAEFPTTKFAGRLVRTSKAITKNTRTLLVEVDVDNPDGKLFPGSYAEVHLAVPGMRSTYLIPTNSLIFRSEGLQVARVKEGKAILTAVIPGHDHGDEIEVLAGVTAGDQVIINPSDSIVSGQEVEIVQAKLPGDIQ